MPKESSQIAVMVVPYNYFYFPFAEGLLYPVMVISKKNLTVKKTWLLIGIALCGNAGLLQFLGTDDSGALTHPVQEKTTLWVHH